MNDNKTIEFRNSLKTFLSHVSVVSSVVSTAVGRLEASAGEQFNVMELAGRIFAHGIREEHTTRVMSFLLDPSESHNHGVTFLKPFIKTFAPDWMKTYDWERSSIVRTDELIDLVLTDGKHWLGIENKIFGAQEQETQSARYLDELRKQANDGPYKLLYLARHGDEPSDFSFPSAARKKHADRLVCGAWVNPTAGDSRSNAGVLRSLPDVLAWLTQCEIECRSEPVLWFIRQFKSYAKSAIRSPSEMTVEDQAVIQLALNSKQNLEAALRIGKVYDQIRCQVSQEFLKLVESRLADWSKKKGPSWELISQWPGGSWVDKPDLQEFPILLRKRSWPDMVGVCLIHEHEELNLCVMGITREKWDKYKNEGKYCKKYGDKKRFIGPASRERLGLTAKRYCQNTRHDTDDDWYPLWLCEFRGDSDYDITPWSKPAVLAQLATDGGAMAQSIVMYMTKLAEAFENIEINEE